MLLSWIILSVLGLANGSASDLQRREPSRTIVFEKHHVATARKGSKFGYFKSNILAGAETLPVGNVKDTTYTTNITLNGKPFVVALDTGSTDLWVYGERQDIGKFKDTEVEIFLGYADGSVGVNGTIGFAPFTMGEFKVEDQVFVNATTVTVQGVIELGIDGLLGLSFDAISIINYVATHTGDANATWGRSVLTNIFTQEPSLPNLFGVDLSRTDDLEDDTGGSLSIGEYDPRYAAVGDAPKPTVFPENATQWQTLLQGISVDGTNLTLKSGVSNVPENNLLALLDTGSPAIVLPSKVIEDIFSCVPGAVGFKDQEGDTAWAIPCNTTTGVVFTFGGQNFPIHPLDLSDLKEVTLNGKNYTECIVPAMGNTELSPDESDGILGTIFLRNVYSVYNFGDKLKNTTTNGTAIAPYMQLLSTIDAEKAASQVSTFRAKTMEGMPPELPPAEFFRLLKQDDPSVELVYPAELPPSNGAKHPRSGIFSLAFGNLLTIAVLFTFVL